MEYLNDPFQYPPQPQRQAQMHMGYMQPMHHPQQYMFNQAAMVGHHHHAATYYGPYGPIEHSEFAHPGMIFDDFGDAEETSTRPRLTKEQVEVLEAHFQENNKPSSAIKKDLAMTYNLGLARVSNWFQNRRAKAKQQKKQEEFAAQTSMKTESKDGAAGKTETASESGSPCRSASSPTKESYSTEATPPSPSKPGDEQKDRGLASIHRPGATNPTEFSGAGQFQPSASMSPIMPPPSIVTNSQSQADFEELIEDQNPGMSLPESSSTLSSFWEEQDTEAVSSSSAILFQDNGFDFGFDDQSAQDATLVSATQKQDAYSVPEDNFPIPDDSWAEASATPKGVVIQQMNPIEEVLSPTSELNPYPESRRQSTTEDLSNTFGTVAIASSSPHIAPQRRASELICPPSNVTLDIAARRKRPRPAALTSAALTPSSLRSRSYGALTAVSPTFRQNTTPTVPHTIRHVKSAGHTLNSRYAGVRKVSSAQRSPINFSFAETEVFNNALAQQAVTLNSQSLAELHAPMLTPDLAAASHSDPEKSQFFAQNLVVTAQCQMPSAQPLAMHTTSPPITPMVPDYMSRGLSQQSMLPPASAPPQYATFPDYTPPYSAGPLTTSSWGDGPLMSPDINSFPPVTYVPSLGYPQEHVRSNFHNFVLPSDNKSEVILDGSVDKKTEFYIQEFPNQKQEHAHIASQLPSAKKNYVFANTAPQDYTGA